MTYKGWYAIKWNQTKTSLKHIDSMDFLDFLLPSVHHTW